jgi:hypothetical protein
MVRGVYRVDSLRALEALVSGDMLLPCPKSSTTRVPVGLRRGAAQPEIICDFPRTMSSGYPTP